uniref:NADH-ubiquinone oxidoreductase chain 3 n=1 Tax=Cylindrus obtusus TaxID=649475 RepID=I1T1X6_9EUPU|nr:NADH dehydrogenase subunit 3 [Cylindrus obtusus]AEK48356.1 NADH dehydrogenase subunit 3 [Cylindrus obtusus]
MVIIFASTALALTVAMYALYSTIKYFPNNVQAAKLSPFECGFETLVSSRRPFSVRFFILVTLFLVFDVESVLLFPCLTSMTSSQPYTLLLSLFVFMLLLLGGLLYEWYNTLLEWYYFK